ncbi:hypothetical protein NC651_002948 [Populus alba x Populus x berolinensis]|nr:hypothetical protein NC651_002948 [Populus alba x Populus x berolinensis]
MLPHRRIMLNQRQLRWKRAAKESEKRSV